MEDIITVRDELRKCFYESELKFLTSVPQRRIQEIIVTVASYVFGGTVVSIFSGTNEVVYREALNSFRIVAVSFILMAFNVFSSGWFTALNDGRTSAVLSFTRTIVFMVVPVLILPRLLGINGVWLSMAAGEGLSLIMTVYYFHKFRGMWKPENNL